MGKDPTPAGDPRHDEWVHGAFGVNPATFGPRNPSSPGGILDPNLIQRTFGNAMFNVSDYLSRHHLMRAGSQVMLDGSTMTVDAVVQRLIGDLRLTVSADVVRGWVENEAGRAQDFWTVGRQQGRAGAAGGGGNAPQYSLSYAFVPATAHVDARTGATSADGPQHQLAFGATISLHPDGVAGPEISWQAQVAGSGDTFTVQNVLQGPQAAWVVPFLNGALQISALASALGGMARGQADASGRVSLVPTVQVGAGGQVTYAIPGMSNHLLIGFQAAASVTATQGSNATVDFSPQAFLQVQWN